MKPIPLHASPSHPSGQGSARFAPTPNSLFLFFLFVTSAASAVDTPPDIQWERQFGAITGGLYDVEPLLDGNILVGGFYHVSSTSWAIVHKLSSEDGSTIWTWTCSNLDTSVIRDVEELPDGRIAVLGGILPMPEYYRFVILATLSAEGQELSRWVVDLEEDALGVCLRPLSDGGYVAGGIIYLTKASVPFVMRVSSSGGLYWEHVYFGTSGSAKSIELDDNGNYLVYITPEDSPPRLLCLDPADGDVLWSYDYTGILPGETGYMCSLPSLGGFALASGGWGAAVTQSGEIIWSQYMPGYNTRTLYSVASTMDGGLIFAGGGHYIPWSPEPPSDPHYYDGWIVRTNNMGLTSWMLDIDNGHEVEYYSARQLAQGGYGVCGWISGTGGVMKAYALAFDPELGIEDEAIVLDELQTDPSPFSAGVEISWSQAQPGNLELTAFDISGRLIGHITDSFYPSGHNSILWVPDEKVSPGVYFLVARSGLETSSAVVVRL